MTYYTVENISVTSNHDQNYATEWTCFQCTINTQSNKQVKNSMVTLDTLSANSPNLFYKKCQKNV